MGTVRTKNRPGITRRDFLSRLAIGSAAAGADLAFPGNILAANGKPASKELPPHYVAGTLSAVAPDRATVYVPNRNPSLVDLLLTEQTDICRGSCELDWTVLKLGDRIDAGTYDGPGGVRVAWWLNANMIAGFGEITAVRGNTLIVQSHSVERELAIHPYTRVIAGKDAVKGRADVLKAGDKLHFTACADDPNLYARRLMGGTLHRIDQIDSAPD